MKDLWIALGWLVVVGLPLTVLVAVIVWPERIPKDRTVEGIRCQIDAEGRGPSVEGADVYIGRPDQRGAARNRRRPPSCGGEQRPGGR
ncbi:hypothetical protein NONO_c49210 [Nocardia nova SH22a]|uniref:Uncharacterized protein n=1 Tax=Nocardia nova SH22a TaxID=1415166 RepID=W5TK16_9NOCA|nr:hypothetical protein [Nocardia nova]AHH19705.1 hypothetical protein NONO_c49210 [Nocardia nova SH22a]